MNIDAYVNARKDEISAEQKDIKTKQQLYSVGNFCNGFCRAFFGITGGLLLVGGMPGVGIAFLSTAVANHISLKNRGKEDNTKLDYLTKEADHIKKIKDNPINGSREMTAKRVRKVNELNAKKEKTASRRKVASFGNGLANVGQLLALATAVCVPSLGWISAATLAAKYFARNAKVEASQEDDLLALRLNNLNLDLEVTRAKQPTPRAAVTTEADTTKVREASDKVETKTYSAEDERLVNAYISSLENVPQKETTKQYTK